MSIRNSNPYGFDVGNTENDNRFVEKDYSIGGGVTMYSEFEHGFTHKDTERKTLQVKRGEHFGKGPKNWTRSDERIKEDICEELSYNPYVDASDIELTVQNGVVYLKGWVNSREEKKEAEKCAEGILGVRDLQNELHMRNRKAF